ncbi:sigma-54-dependent Fis family transcriptional regulator [Bacillus salacetis]|uniref:Sigma-54-dependent Fis family transcriptional regulator n=1 Tax=Bacillus salacetis TaxID=2315464 RepID=A0A3A1QTQ5_9BACI|nr:sigma-54-dependent Fis family transcriptional regulator [Bacillus salacetis]RIW29180.1 sigma-54-dependent Fis family transcriptional regulator [Bacillus salacetis]
MQKKIKTLAIAPYEGLKDLINNVAKERSELEIQTVIGNMLEGLEIVKEKSSEQFDLIISRAGTADMIKEVTDLPVIDIKLSIVDMMRAIKLTQNYTGKFAIVGFKSITEPAAIISQLNEYDFTIRTLSHISEIDDSLQELKEQGVSLIVGDVITTSHAKLLGLNTILVTSGRESVNNAFSEGIQLFEYLSAAKRKNAFFNEINQQLNVTVISFDEASNPVYSNTDETALSIAAEELLDVLNKESEIRVVKTIGDDHYKIEGKILSFQKSCYPTFYLEKQRPPLKPFDKSITYKNVTDRPQINFEAFPTSNPTYSKIITEAKAYSKLNTPIMIYGEKGSGKNILAHAIYQNSQSRKNPMILINAKYMNEKSWTSIFKSENSPFLNSDYTIYIRNIHFLNEESQNLLESYLSNTYVHKRNRFIFSCISGYSNMFDNGTLVDFINNEMGAFPLVLPNLNHRKEDIASLASIFLSDLIPKYGKQVLGLKKEALDLLQEFNWTYNIDQLRRVIEELIILTDDYYIEPESVKRVLANESLPKAKIETNFIDLNKTLDEINKDIIELVLSEEGYNHSKAAKRLGISRSTLWRKVK